MGGKSAAARAAETTVFPCCCHLLIQDTWCTPWMHRHCVMEDLGGVEIDCKGIDDAAQWCQCFLEEFQQYRGYVGFQLFFPNVWSLMQKSFWFPELIRSPGMPVLAAEPPIHQKRTTALEHFAASMILPTVARAAVVSSSSVCPGWVHSG